VRGDPINGFIPTHLYVCPKPGLEFQRHMSWSFLMFYELRGDVIIRFVDIGGIIIQQSQ
jgi:hypothetical protein